MYRNIEQLKTARATLAEAADKALVRPSKAVVPATYDKCVMLPGVDSAAHILGDAIKAYKIQVRPVKSDGRFTTIGFVIVGRNGNKMAVDVYGKRHDIEQTKRLREKHVRKAFLVDERFSVKQLCIQYETQWNSEKPLRQPTTPNRPVLRRPKIG